MELEFRQWTLEQIESNPQLYGGDNGNPAILQQYFTVMHGRTRAEDLTLGAFSQSVAVSRMRNKILKQRPDLDYRVVHKPKPRKKHFINDEVA